MDASPVKPLLTFGVLTDVQYADRDDCSSWYCAEKVRYYRTSLDHIRKAFKTWQTEAHHPVQFVVQLGDLLDGCNRAMDHLDPDVAARKVLSVFDEFPTIPTYHVLGNHELDNFDRKQLSSYFRFGGVFRSRSQPTAAKLNSCLSLCKERNDLKEVEAEQNVRDDAMLFAYYSFRPVSDVLVIVLDCYDVCFPYYDRNKTAYADVRKFLEQFHTSDDTAMWDYDDHLEGVDKRFVAYNGAVGPEQLHWLDNELQTAQANGQRVVVCGHIALLPESSSPSCVLWNYTEVLKVMHRYSCIVAYLAGHLHDTGYAMDNNGIHHVTFAGIIEVDPEDMAFSTVHVFSDRLEILGYGRERCYTLKLCKS